MRRLLISSVIGRLPLSTCSLAVLLLVRACTHSFALSGLVVGALALTQAGVGPVAGRCLDRFGAARVLVPSAVLQASALGLLAFFAHGKPAAIPLVALGAVIGGATPPVAAAARALWPRLLPEREKRDAAFSLDAIGQELAWTTGPLLVGVVAGLLSPAAAVLTVAGVTLLSSAWFVTSVAALRLGRISASGSGSRLKMSRITLILLPTSGLLGLSLGGLQVGLPALATHLSNPSVGGILLALWSIGSMAGGLAFSARYWQTSRERLLPLLLLLNSAFVVPLIFANDFGSAAAASLIAGVCLAPIFACLSSLIGEHAPAAARAEAFTWITAALVFGVAAGSALCGAIVSIGGVKVAIAVAGGIGVAGGVIALSLHSWAARTGLFVS